ncbi:MAG: hypothetical protein WDN50_07870 [Bradyrhizobium sp.]
MPSYLFHVRREKKSKFRKPNGFGASSKLVTDFGHEFVGEQFRKAIQNLQRDAAAASDPTATTRRTR